MAQSYLIFDFGANERAAQQARHRIESWKQAFRLDKKLQLKFERRPAERTEDEEPTQKEKTGEAGSEEGERIRLFVRLDFSDHERLSHHRWLERIPIEEPFKEAQSQIIRHGEDGFATTAELFDSLP